MHFRLSIFTFFLLSSAVLADELPWLGVILEPLQASDRLNTELDDGVGLKVSKVVSGGPLAKARGRAGDLWWKFEGHALQSKEQMLQLLREKAPGSSVEIRYFRQGVPKSLIVTLGTPKSRAERMALYQTDQPDSSRVLTKREQVARLTNGKEILTLQRENTDWRFKVSEGEKTKLSVLVNEANLSEMLPTKWHNSFLILRLTLGKQGDSKSGNTKERVRYISRDKGPKE